MQLNMLLNPSPKLPKCPCPLKPEWLLMQEKQLQVWTVLMVTITFSGGNSYFFMMVTIVFSDGKCTCIL